MVVEKPLLGEVLAALVADERPLSGVHPVVHVEVGLPGVGLRADGADERLLAGVHADVLLQRVVVVAGLVAHRTHEVGGARVGGHVGAEGGLPAERLGALAAREVPLPGVGHQVGRVLVVVLEYLVAVAARVAAPDPVLSDLGFPRSGAGEIRHGVRVVALGGPVVAGRARKSKEDIQYLSSGVDRNAKNKTYLILAMFTG